MKFLPTHGTNCSDCYKCIRFCPLKAIHFEHGQAQVLDDECIYDGLCTQVCPQGVKTVVDQQELLRQWLDQNETVIALMNPSYLGLRDDPFALVGSLFELGVTRVEETAWAIPSVSASYWQEDDKNPGILSACPAVVRLVQIHFPALVPNLLHVVSPAVAHARSVRQRYPTAKICAVGGCAAAKWEQSQFEADLDAVFSFAEISRLLEKRNIDMAEAAPSAPDLSGTATARQFPLPTGWERSWQGGDIRGRTWAVNGFRQCIDFLKAVEAGAIKGQWAQLQICPGGCLGGTGWPQQESVFARKSRLLARLHSHRREERLPWEPVNLERNYEEAPPPLHVPDPDTVAAVMTRNKKNGLHEQLDCGACGYDSCRDLAAAVAAGKASSEMCIPGSRVQAENMAKIIIDATPNGTIVVDPEMNILALNPAAEKMFQCSGRLLQGEPLRTLMPESSFQAARREQRMIIANKVFPEFSLATREIVFPVQGRDVIIGIFIDITKEQQRDEEMQHLKTETLKRAGEVIEKQMRVAHEIAGLLGETTGETKILLSQLMRFMDTETAADKGGAAHVRGKGLRRDS